MSERDRKAFNEAMNEAVDTLSRVADGHERRERIRETMGLLYGFQIGVNALVFEGQTPDEFLETLGLDLSELGKRRDGE